MTETDDKFNKLTESSIKCTEELINKLIKKMEKEGQINLWHQTWQRLWYVTNYTYLVLHFYKNDILPNNFQNSILLKLFNIRENNVDYAVKVTSNFKTILKTSFLTECLFQIEYPLREINSKLFNPTKDKKIILIAKHILRELQLSEYQEKVDAIKCPYLIRNSLHNWGIFTDKDDNVTVRGKNYKFENGKHQEFIHWENICMFLDELIDVVDQMIDAYKKQSQNITQT